MPSLFSITSFYLSCCSAFVSALSCTVMSRNDHSCGPYFSASYFIYYYFFFPLSTSRLLCSFSSFSRSGLTFLSALFPSLIISSTFNSLQLISYSNLLDISSSEFFLLFTSTTTHSILYRIILFSLLFPFSLISISTLFLTSPISLIYCFYSFCTCFLYYLPFYCLKHPSIPAAHWVIFNFPV